MEGFNRFSSVVVVLYFKMPRHFLNKLDSVTNILACIVRSLQGMEFLNLLSAFGAILGIHTIQRFLSVTY